MLGRRLADRGMAGTGERAGEGGRGRGGSGEGYAKVRRTRGRNFPLLLLSLLLLAPLGRRLRLPAFSQTEMAAAIKPRPKDGR